MNNLKLVTPCCQSNFTYVEESLGSYLGDEITGYECMGKDCFNQWDKSGNLFITRRFITVVEPNGEVHDDITVYGEVSELDDKEKQYQDAVKKHGLLEGMKLMNAW